jgi:hypothetical protein
MRAPWPPTYDGCAADPPCAPYASILMLVTPAGTVKFCHPPVKSKGVHPGTHPLPPPGWQWVRDWVGVMTNAAAHKGAAAILQQAQWRLWLT